MDREWVDNGLTETSNERTQSPNHRIMRETTRKKYERIQQAAAHMYGSMPAMQLYTALAEDFCLSEERIRKILASKTKKTPKMHPP